MFSRACRFDGGVERQQIGLASNLFNDGNPARNFLHGSDCLDHRSAAFLGILRRFVGDFVGLLRVVGVLLDVRDHLFHRGRGFFRGSRLRGSSARYLYRGSADGHAGRADFAGNGTNLADGPSQVMDHGGQGLHQFVFF